MLLLFFPLPLLALAAEPIQIKSSGNPLLADGSFYSADPAPIVVNNTVYIIAGRDTAPRNVNSFVQNEWEMFKLDSPDPINSPRTLYPGVANPKGVFKWAAPGTSYAAQVVQAGQKFWLYAPVTEAGSRKQDKFAIGVGVADNVLGPYKDAHPAGPIISQTVPPPGNSIQNIDPTVMIDDDGKVYLYWGTFGQLRGVELEKDMVTQKGTPITVRSLTGFFEAAWIMKRKNTYYLLYAGNNASPNSPCTPTSYHACIAYGSSSGPLGPWKYQGTILDIVSSTTSHSGAFELNGKWYLTYHTADADGGGHFRRSVAIDELTWDDSQSPPRINKVKQTKRVKAKTATRNVAPEAKAASLNPTPIQYWVEALHDGRIPSTPLPPDYWSSYAAERSAERSTLVYTWSKSVTLAATRMAFFADQPAGSSIGVAPPASWYIVYLDSTGAWKKIVNASPYSLAVTDNPPEVKFEKIQTTSIRAVLTASGRNGKFAGVGVKEWEALTP